LPVYSSGREECRNPLKEVREEVREIGKEATRLQRRYQLKGGEANTLREKKGVRGKARCDGKKKEKRRNSKKLRLPKEREEDRRRYKGMGGASRSKTVRGRQIARVQEKNRDPGKGEKRRG